MLKTLSNAIYPSSYYAKTANSSNEHPSLEGDRECDVCVIGAGFTGLAAALELAKKGYDVILLESSRIGWGASGRNGGQLGSAHAVLQPELTQKYGAQTARKLWDIAEDAKAYVKHLIKTHHIQCDYVAGNLGCAVTNGDFDDFKAHFDISSSYGYGHYQIYDRDEVTRTSGSNAYVGGIYDPTAGHLHPLNLALGYAEACVKAGVKIHEVSPVKDIGKTNPAIVKTAKGNVKAKFVILGCNGYLGKLNREMANKIVPLDNYQLVTEPLNEELAQSIITNNTCLWDTHKQVYYYRLTPDNRLVFGGGLGLPGREPKDMKSVVRKHMLNVYPQLENIKIDYAWGGTLAGTLSHLPDFGKLADNIFFGQGYSGHGVALGAYGGKLIADIVSGTAEQFDVLASIPQATIPGGIYLRTPGLLFQFMQFRIMDAFRALQK